MPAGITAAEIDEEGFLTIFVGAAVKVGEAAGRAGKACRGEGADDLKKVLLEAVASGVRAGLAVDGAVEFEKPENRKAGFVAAGCLVDAGA